MAESDPPESVPPSPRGPVSERVTFDLRGRQRFGCIPDRLAEAVAAITTR